MTPIKKATMRKLRLGFTLFFVVSALLAARWATDQGAGLEQALSWVQDSGWLGVLAFVALYVLSALLCLPGAPMTLGAGAIYGLWPGFALVSLASTLGALATFAVARRWRSPVQRLMSRYTWLTALERAMLASPLRLVLLTRLSPMFPYNLLNYALGLTPLPWRSYLWGSWIGMMPGTLLYVALGAGARQVTSGASGAGAAHAAPSWVQWAWGGLGIAATLGVTLWIGARAKRELAAMLAEQASTTHAMDPDHDPDHEPAYEPAHDPAHEPTQGEARA